MLVMGDDGLGMDVDRYGSLRGFRCDVMDGQLFTLVAYMNIVLRV
jgi:hypothetical protein